MLLVALIEERQTDVGGHCLLVELQTGSRVVGRARAIPFQVALWYKLRQ
jgi:hypothetical protein